MINLRIIKSYRDIVAICDSSILGKKFEEKPVNEQGFVKQLDVKESFYRGEEVSEKEAIEIIKKFSREDATFNIVGEESIAAALKAGIIGEESIGKIQGIPFALVLL